jgi:hypothetical protein
MVEVLGRLGALAINQQGGCALVITNGARQQRVVVKRNGGELLILAHVCSIRYIAPVEALQYNGCAERWSLVLKRQAYLLKRALPNASLTTSRLRDEVVSIAEEAARISRRQRASPMDEATWRVCIATFAHCSQ